MIPKKEYPKTDFNLSNKNFAEDHNLSAFNTPFLKKKKKVQVVQSLRNIRASPGLPKKNRLSLLKKRDNFEGDLDVDQIEKEKSKLVLKRPNLEQEEEGSFNNEESPFPKSESQNLHFEFHSHGINPFLKDSQQKFTTNIPQVSYNTLKTFKFKK